MQVRTVAVLVVMVVACLAGLAPSRAPAAPANLAIDALAVLEDPAGTRDIDGVRSDPAFRPLPGGLSAGYTEKVHWLRFTVQAPAAGTWWLLVQPTMLDDVRLYAPDPHVPGGFIETRAGNAVPFHLRAVPLREHVIPIERPDARPATYYLRLHTRSVSLLRLELLSPVEFMRRDALATLAAGLYFGCLGLLMLQHVMHWVWRRETLSKYFVLYLLGTVAVSLGMSGYLQQYLVPAQPELGIRLRLVFICVLLTLAAPFYWRLLGLGDRTGPLRRLHAFVLLLPLAMAALANLGHVGAAVAAVAALAMLANLVGIWITARQVLAGVPGARFALCAYLLAQATVVMTVLPASGLSTSVALLQYGHQLGAVAVALSFHFTLVMRLRQQDAERTRAIARAEGAEREMQRAARERQEQGQFIAMLSHELKTPLAMIDGALQSLLHLVDEPDGRRRLDRMRRAVRRIDLLVEQFLRADRLDDLALRLQRQTLDVADLCARVRQESAHGERILLRAPQALAVHADAALLRVALVNLIDNAAKYGPPESPIELAATAAHGVAEIVVADRGPGVPEEVVPRLFERYVRGQRAGDVPGTGLGLHLVRRVAQLHGGDAAYAAREGGGSVFCVRLPLGALP